MQRSDGHRKLVNSIAPELLKEFKLKLAQYFPQSREGRGLKGQGHRQHFSNKIAFYYKANHPRMRAFS